MRFVIVGYGRVGRRTARILGSEDHEVVIVEKDADKAARAEEDGFETIHGDGQDGEVIDQVDLASADAIGALTGDLNTNFTACMFGAENGCRTVLRIDEDYRAEIYEKYAADVDEIIYPERLGAAGAKTAMLGGDFNVLTELTERLSMASITVPEDSPLIGTRVVEMDLPGDAYVYTHGRGNESMTIPLPRTEIEAGDNIGVLADPESLSTVRATLRGE